MKTENRKWWILSILTVILIIVLILIGKSLDRPSTEYNDGIVTIDANTVFLPSSGIKVSFSDVILSQPEETRELIVSTLRGTVSATLSESMFKPVDWEILKKNQKVTYAGTGYFSVDLSSLTEQSLVVNDQNRSVTIRIPHPSLKSIDINPNDIIIDEIKKGLLAWGSIKMTVEDYNTIEKELRARLEEKFNNAYNQKKADEQALNMVKAVYEPVVLAVDNRYTVEIEFA